MEFIINLNKIEDLQKFIKSSSKYDCGITVMSYDKKFTVDGTSIMGLLSLDLSKPVFVHVEDDKDGELFRKEVLRFGVL